MDIAILNDFVFIGVLVLILLGLAVFLTVFLTKKIALKKMHRTIVKAEHNYQQQIGTLQQQLSTKVEMLENMVEKLTLSNQELNRLSEIKSKFMSIVAHDLKQPLSSIQGLTSVLMLDGVAGGGVGDQQALNNILKATDNMNMLMSDLMDISMIEAGKFKMDFKEFELNGLINDIYAMQHINAQKKGINIIRYDYPEPIVIQADRFRISQVLNNLLSNAIKFTPQGGRIEIRFNLEDTVAKVFIKDNGPGIEHSELQKIFEKFHQSSSLDKRSRRQGWGLGLAISCEIIKSHHGDIGAISNGVGHGTVFIIELPLKQTEAL
ncbi:Putative two-component system [Elusimicrobium minutum Pei191]|uniref:histidine kinase n=1 Tax=Elusimicrobium minutum (strain Pei191) TaxID=445932 RepID=B2KCE5_ELUMP|nr:HAMP domain-containing sensor histidine kinase [Elusimicrobium minutum]ACC98066.1 Putative two-component system [Elusimicrobium minutum Pei191]